MVTNKLTFIIFLVIAIFVVKPDKRQYSYVFMIINDQYFTYKFIDIKIFIYAKITV